MRYASSKATVTKTAHPATMRYASSKASRNGIGNGNMQAAKEMEICKQQKGDMQAAKR